MANVSLWTLFISEVKIFIWRFKTQAMAKVMVINQIGNMISSDKMSSKIVKSSIIKTYNIFFRILFSKIAILPLTTFYWSPYEGLMSSQSNKTWESWKFMSLWCSSHCHLQGNPIRESGGNHIKKWIVIYELCQRLWVVGFYGW